MKYIIYQVDAFAETVFSGNPAAIIPLTDWISDGLMQQIAAENNLSETAYYVMKGDRIEIRWFTPATEVDLCGHATLAAAYVLKNQENFQDSIIPFYSHRSGSLPVSVGQDTFTLNFPADTIQEVALTDTLISIAEARPVRAYKGKTDYMLVYESEQEIEQMIPDLLAISKLDARGLIVTAKGNKVNFVSRFFGPQCGVNEDPVTGSAHTTLTPYWAAVLGANKLEAIQMSSRRGKLTCELKNDRVEITGKAVLYMKGEIELNSTI